MIRSLAGTTLNLTVRSSRRRSVRYNSTIEIPRVMPPHATREIMVDNKILYITREIAESLGWKPDQGANGIPLTLYGREPSFFTITPTGSDSDRLSKLTVKISYEEPVKTALDHLKDR